MRTLTLTVLWLMVLISTGCGADEEVVRKPKDLIGKEKMISFLIDLHLAEAKVSYANIRGTDSMEIAFRNYERYLFDKHNIQDSTYYRSYEYYLSNMNEMHQIYTAVVDSLSILNSMEKNKDFVSNE